MDSVRVLLGGASSGVQNAARSGRGRRPRAKRAASRFVHLLTVMFFLSSLLSPIAAQTAFAQDQVPQENPVVIVDTDGDGIDNAADSTPNGDDDGDGVDNAADLCLAGDDAADADGDGTADACDTTPNGDVPTEPEAATVAVEVAEELVVVEGAEAVSCVTAEGASPWIVSDLADYPPGALVTLTGGNWVAGQTVEIFVDDDNVADAEMGPWSHSATVTADDAGNLFYQFNLAPWFVANYTVVATGECTTVTTQFTDGNVTVKVSGGGSDLTIGWEKFDGTNGANGLPNTTCRGTANSSDSMDPNTAKAAGKDDSLRFTAPDQSASGWTFQGWSGATSGTNRSICVAGSAGTQEITATYARTVVQKQDQTITFTSTAPTNAMYGDIYTPTATGANSGNAVTCSASGGCSDSSGTGVVTMTGTGNCTVTADQADNVDYNAAAQKTQVFSVGKRAVTVTVDAGQAKTYGDAEPATFDYQITAGSLAQGDSFSGALSRSAGEDVGEYAIGQNTLALSANYELTFQGADFEITKKVALMTPDAASKTYGQAEPTLSGTLSGFLAGDGVTATYSRVTGENAGTYTISATLSPASVLGNYDITYGTASFTINKVQLKVTGFYQAYRHGGDQHHEGWQYGSGQIRSLRR